MDGSNWEQWFRPNWEFRRQKEDGDPEYFSYILSPDCSSCDIANNVEGNPLRFFNTDLEYGDRTAYHMTGTMFGCLTTHKALKDCSWDYDSYECVMCSLGESDQDLGYHIVHSGDDDEPYYQEECAQSDYSWRNLQVTCCHDMIHIHFHGPFGTTL